MYLHSSTWSSSHGVLEYGFLCNRSGVRSGQAKALADNTHFNPYGAYEVAKMVVQGMKTLHLPLADHIRADWTGFDPSEPDGPSSFVWPDSRRYEMVKPDGN